MAGLMEYVNVIMNSPTLSPDEVADNRVTSVPAAQDFTHPAIRRFENMISEQGLLDITPLLIPGPKGYGSYASMYKGAEREVPNLSRFGIKDLPVPKEDLVQRGLISQELAWELGSARAWQSQLERMWDKHPVWKHRKTFENILKNPMLKPTVSQATSIIPRLLMEDDNGK
jgi:hypothetical protein